LIKQVEWSRSLKNRKRSPPKLRLDLAESRLAHSLPELFGEIPKHLTHFDILSSSSYLP